MSDEIKNFFSTSFSIIAVVAMCLGLYFLKDYGWDTSKYYFITGAVFSIIAIAIEFTRAQNYDGDGF